MLEEISARSKSLKRWLKVPMVLTQFLAASMSGIDQILIKFGQIMIYAGLINTQWFLIISLIGAGIALALSNLHFVNQGIRYYDATDCIPVTNAAQMLAELSCGLILGGEMVLYTSDRLMWILINSLVVVAGIQVLVMKTSQLSLDQNRND